MATENTDKLLTEIISKIDNLNTEMKSEFKQINTRFNEVEKSIVKIEERVAGIDKRLSNEETISRTALGAIAGGTVLAVAKYLFFPN
ncbi:MAG: hypothetical protein QNJ55_33545 [Xenococcus sp. MO_188.B8]|nr:hypothetical protein [Xenococcus sp. MO_188.B8]